MRVDEWIVGKSSHSARTYMIHTANPRFVLEVIDLGNRQWKAGALDWIDDPGGANAARWTRQAVDVYFMSIEMGRGA